MPLNEIAGYILSLLVGLSIGMLGGGGGILAVPVFIYLFGFSAEISTVYSLFAVGVTSTFSFLRKFGKYKFYPEIFFYFGVPSFIAVYLTKAYIIPLIPKIILFSPEIIISKNMLIMFLYSFILTLSASSMLKEKSNDEVSNLKSGNSFSLFRQGIIVGLVTGFIGAGGGFLIIPALITYLGLSMKDAIINSLAIIILNSFVGFIGYAGKGVTGYNWKVLLIFGGFSLIGTFLGDVINHKITGKMLKKIFGWMLLLLAIFLMLYEILYKFQVISNFVKSLILGLKLK